MDLQLADKLALVSGSTKGIGLAIATGLAREDANVIINGRSEDSVDGAFAKIRETVPDAKLGSFAGDLSDALVVEKLAKQFPAVDMAMLTRLKAIGFG
jgi:NAD(P)-dependent dehydrogenase (short-subunit alcohol dehydrogenase family)